MSKAYCRCRRPDSYCHAGSGSRVLRRSGSRRQEMQNSFGKPDGQTMLMIGTKSCATKEDAKGCTECQKRKMLTKLR